MSTITYKGWLNIERPRRKRFETIILAPCRLFYKPRKYVLLDKIEKDIKEHGKYVAIKIWYSHKKIKKTHGYKACCLMGKLEADYSEIHGAYSGYMYTQQTLLLEKANLLKTLEGYRHLYVIIEISYHNDEYDLISSEIEKILLLDSTI